MTHAIRRFTGRVDQVRHARRFVAAEIGDRPAADIAVLLTSELAANAVLHTRSGHGGTFEVGVRLDVDVVRVEVSDQGCASGLRPGATAPVAPADSVASTRSVDDRSTSGRGLAIVAGCAARWGQDGGAAGRTVWFELDLADPPR
ncbi:ATP-binding protein [Spirillospora albida]|uniref:ATP-binding protein n=1 Tax=Spirillospora albida TaxID=58123 RepID=UPI0004BF57D7|nr:ATP-binding protein [Spirillospora albida]